jgi:hypothetical protein
MATTSSSSAGAPVNGTVSSRSGPGISVKVSVREPVADQETVSCVISGHHRDARELISGSIEVDAGPSVWSGQGRCG